MENSVKAKADKIIADRKAIRKDRLLQRRREIFDKFPEIEQIEQKFDQSGINMINCVLEKSCTPEEAVRRIMEENRLADARRRAILVENGYSADYTDDVPFCEKCADSGYVDGNLCSCIRSELNRALATEANLSEKLREQTFKTFKFDYYSQKTDPNLGFSPYENIRSVYRLCEEFAHDFDIIDKNLFFTGGCGLGKTFLSSAIANFLIDKGKDVLYVSANSLFPILEDLHFNRDVNEKNQYLVEHIMECELLILDDLGAEFVTPFTSAELFRIINNRLLNGLKNIISTNMDLNELKKRYSERIYSRIIGSFDVVGFFGDDIRRTIKMTR